MGKQKHREICLAMAVFVLSLLSPAEAKAIFVDAEAPGANDGSSWHDGFNHLQDALAAAEPHTEIRVAQGIYRPDKGGGIARGDRTATFQLKNNVTINGGYAGCGQPDPNARDTDLYETILSGDLDGNDVDVSDPCDLLNDPARAENSYHVVTGSGADESAVLEGFIITGGNANGPGPPSDQDHGGGMYSNGSLVGLTCPVVRNCRFTKNSAAVAGAAVCNWALSSPAFYHCEFKTNAAYGGGGGVHAGYGSNSIFIDCTFADNLALRSPGGGMLNYDSSPVLQNCKFIRNWALSGGGGVHNQNTEMNDDGIEAAKPVLIDCLFIDNYSTAEEGEDWGAGGVYNYWCSPRLSGCIFSDNSSLGTGGLLNLSSSPEIINCTFSGNYGGRAAGMSNFYYSYPMIMNCRFSGNNARAIYNSWSSPTVINCTFSGNRAGWGGGAIDNDWNSAPRLMNCILWDNKPEEINLDSGTRPDITYSDIRGGWGGRGNIDTDPCFAGPGYWEDPCNTPTYCWDDVWVAGDYHLKSQAGRWNPNKQEWVKDDVTGPCIDAGDPASPIGLEPFPNGGIINMGAYGGTAEASKSYFGKPLCEPIVAGDINGDCEVNFLDFGFIALHWLTSSDP